MGDKKGLFSRRRACVGRVTGSGCGVDVGLVIGDEVESCGRVFVFSRVANGSGWIWVYEKKKNGGLFKRPVVLRTWRKVL